MRRFGWLVLVLVSAALAAAPAAHAEKRLALLIGNQSYTSEIGKLANPHNDIALLEKAQKGLQFEVTPVRDAGLAALHQAVNAYVRRVRAAGPNAVGFFYYAGHGAADSAAKPAPVVEPAVGLFSASCAPLPLKAAEERALKPKDGFKECGTCPEMVVVPAGSFTMGSPPGEVGRRANEGPQRQVTIARPFAVGKFEVTFAEWDACVSAGGCAGNKSPSDRGWGRGRRPVINVSWHNAKEYAAWLSRTTGKSYRLLTEAEWEYTARAGTTTPFSTGRTITADQANFNGEYTYGGSAKGVYRQKTVEVGSFQPNAFGLHDMHGNVWEWVEDCWHDNYQGGPTDGSAWTTGYCSRRVIRGGSWYSFPQVLRAADRGGDSTGGRSDLLGFRVGRTLTP